MCETVKVLNSYENLLEKGVFMKKKFLVVLSLAGLFCLGMTSMSAEAAWKITSAGRMYTTKSELGYVTGWKKIGKYTYYFDKNGYAQTGWKLIENKWYFFDVKGRMLTKRWVDGFYLGSKGYVTKAASSSNTDSTSSGSADTSVKNGWVKRNGKWYYYDYRGKKVKGWLTIQDKTYYLDPSTGARKTGVVKIDKKYYYFNTKTGLQETGWKTYKKNRYYFSKKTKAACTGWTKISKYYYYFTSSGKLQKSKWIKNTYYVDSKGRCVYGWLTLGDDRYYLDPETGERTTGWETIDGKTYYFGSDGKLNQSSGVVTIGKKKYYFSPKTGEQKTGWVTYHGKKYYFDPETGASARGWTKIKGKYYYFNNKNYLLTNRWINSSYHVDENGVRQYGWLTVDGETFYLNDETGKKETGWLEIDGKTYYFNKSGVMVSNKWVSSRYLGEDGVMIVDAWVGSYYVGSDGKRTGQTRTTGLFTDSDGAVYYLDSDYNPTVGWVTISRKKYYFDRTSGQMLKSQWYRGYYFDESGVNPRNEFVSVDGAVYYLNGSGQAAKGLITVNGENYYMGTDGIMVTGLVELDNKTYYFDEDNGGAMIYSATREINGVTYHFGMDGALLASSTGVGDASLGQSIADYALQFEGYPYVYGGNSLTMDGGVDCSAFVQIIHAYFGISIPRTAATQATGADPYGIGYATPTTVTVSELLPGDLIFYYSPISHVALYIGDGKIIHASNEKDGIKISPYNYTTIVKCVRYW